MCVIVPQILVDPYWNLKDDNDNKPDYAQFILVAPYWNLKVVLPSVNVAKLSILVAPYWNLKGQCG